MYKSDEGQPSLWLKVGDETKSVEIPETLLRQALRGQGTVLEQIVNLTTAENDEVGEVTLAEMRYERGEVLRTLVHILSKLRSIKNFKRFHCASLHKWIEDVLKDKATTSVIVCFVEQHTSGGQKQPEDRFKNHNHRLQFGPNQQVTESVYRILRHDVYGTCVPPYMLTGDRRSVTRDWAASRTLQKKTRKPMAFYAINPDSQKMTEFALLDEHAKILDFGAQEDNRTVWVHGVRLVSMFDPEMNVKNSRKLDRARVTTMKIRPLRVNIPANQQVKVSNIRAIFHHPLRVNTWRQTKPKGEEPKGTPKQWASSLRVHISLVYPKPPPIPPSPTVVAPTNVKEDDDTMDTTKASDAHVQDGGNRKRNWLKKLGPHEPFGKHKVTLDQIEFKGLDVFYQDLAAIKEQDSAAMKKHREKIKRAQEDAFPDGYAGKYRNPGFADRGIKRFLTVYAPLE